MRCCCLGAALRCCSSWIHCYSLCRWNVCMFGMLDNPGSPVICYRYIKCYRLNTNILESSRRINENNCASFQYVPLCFKWLIIYLCKYGGAPKLQLQVQAYIAMVFKNIGVGKSRLTAVHMGKDMQVMILTIDLVTGSCTHNCKVTFPTPADEF